MRAQKNQVPHRSAGSRCFLYSKCTAYIYLGGLVEGSVGVDVVIQNNDSYHHPHAKQECVLTAEAT